MLGTFKTSLSEAYEGSLRSLLYRLINRKHAYMYTPTVDSQSVVQESIMAELDLTVKFFEKREFEMFKEKARQSSKADYTWLITVPIKSYKIRPLERMEIETLAYQIKPEHLNTCIRQFRKQINIETETDDLSGMMKQTLRKILGEYEVLRYTSELNKMGLLQRIRSETRVYPAMGDQQHQLQHQAVIANSNSLTFADHLV